MGMCRWMGSHLHNWHHGVAFSIELLEWGRAFSDCGVRQVFIFTNIPECLYCRGKVKCSLFNIRYIHKYKVTNLGSPKITYLPESD